MANIMNLQNLPGEFSEHFDDFMGKISTLYLGGAAGSQKIYVNIDRLEPGATSTVYHSHSLQEEFFLILQGSGTLRWNGEEYPVKQGDFIAKPAGQGIAHTFLNTGETLLEILDVGTNEIGDVAHYPDEDVYYLRDQKLKFKGQDAIDFETEPNAK
ncbi:cupin domain-containing protein [Tumebacillus flagellatus]|uniref:Mannose-6-phosphate isomerase n=1 Tax=Tumebacillus flagellatus TaxID=1157490 RepID=A0A074LT33_9BACL|nr:cupin domain-containing protein [Tumebacillus flagellatus]KEO83645.1 mannose-6-phosphate isomerase [Tumebacillus flagellatus]